VQFESVFKAPVKSVHSGTRIAFWLRRRATRQIQNWEGRGREWKRETELGDPEVKE
jgi:hypothetical protein